MGGGRRLADSSWMGLPALISSLVPLMCIHRLAPVSALTSRLPHEHQEEAKYALFDRERRDHDRGILGSICCLETALVVLSPGQVT